MPAVKSIPIRDPENGSVVGQRFEASSTFQAALARNYVAMKDEKGREIRANKKLVHHFNDKGYEVVSKGKQEKT